MATDLYIMLRQPCAAMPRQQLCFTHEGTRIGEYGDRSAMRALILLGRSTHRPVIEGRLVSAGRSSVRDSGDRASWRQTGRISRSVG